ncbi:MAG TPA: polyphosphate kinase 1 [Blastocatellia bacterium]|nr:polyphosphate kinase 1 [Blastocatellia bacterium]
MTDAIKRARNDAASSDIRNITLPPTLFLHTQLLFNRELAWLEFNQRVLEEGLDHAHPLLERLKFLSIFSSNLDEFFMIRVSGLKQQLEHGVTERTLDGMTTTAQLKAIRERLRPMVDEQMRCLRDDVLQELLDAGIVIAPFRALSDRERRSLNAYFSENVFPVLTPQAVDPGHPFPYISNLSLNLGVMIQPPDDAANAEPRFARIKVPPIVPRLVPVAQGAHEFTSLEELIAANVSSLFPRTETGEPHAFRVTRDADIDIREDEANDLLRMMEEQLRRRRFGTAVRLEVASTMPGEMVRYLASRLELTAEDVYVVDGPLNVPDLMSLYQLERPELKDGPLIASTPAPLRTEGSIFDVIRRQDVLVHHPYNSFSSVCDFISTAAADPEVVAIKMALYRTGQNSPIVQALAEACEAGKQVAVLVELKARFDEENNITWARKLERAGVHVVYGLVGLKTHCKLALVVRREEGSLRRFVHIGTGNYNPSTARIYTDLGLFTSNEQIGADATDLFNYLTGFSRQTHFRKLLIAPVNLREALMTLVAREVEHHEAGRPARIIAKLNSLTDTKMIRALYEASQAGVRIDLIVRGICTLRPGVSGLSDRITVTSIVGRFLEHSRIFYFANGGDEEVYIGSADWMLRNLDRRVELVVPIEDPHLRQHLKSGVLDVYLRDNVKARRLLVDGSYERVQAAPGEERVDSQAQLIESLGD